MFVKMHIPFNSILYIFFPEMDLIFHISSLVLLFLQYFLPVALMTFFYSMVAR